MKSRGESRAVNTIEKREQIIETAQTSLRERAGKAAAPPLTADEIRQMIEEAAYYLAEQRGFEPGHELDDWLLAEAQVLDSIAEAVG